MSVPQYQRQQGKLAVLTDALRLTTYSRQILNNPKNFPKEIDDDLLERLRTDADEIYRYAFLANDIRVVSRTTMLARDGLQVKSLQACLKLIVDINIAYKIFHISTKRVAYWVEMAESVRKNLKAWRASDHKKNQGEYGRCDTS